MKTVFLLSAVSVAALLSSTARGEVRTFAMEGTVSYVNDPVHILDWVNVNSDRMVYTFSFDSDAVDKNPLSSIGEYDGFAATLRVGNTTIPVTPPLIQIGHPSDIFRLQSHLVLASYPGDAYLTLADQGPISDALTDTSLPTVPYDLEPWALKYFDFGVQVPGGGTPDTIVAFGGNIDLFYAVPEPGAVSLLAIAALLLHRKHR